ncbi:bifunctional 4-hydroxy-2-oxoglutarate aldolase/2-dehydro-3-deoxy-phosphogluconate aldolase [Hyphococcus sp. DH-69]|uniref:bifunctional 4-hydroxy-2-oxoglutarate aldolase/2-dehydro-3-deoxy-phosphogluconate aldolase n=1 Tax=Hyphococcus formosus TaxID=3143534 RepID=UPI00398B2C17
MQISEIFRAATVIPVIEITKLERAEKLAEILSQAKLRVVELTLRTPCALDALAVMKKTAPDLIIGMGTVRTEHDIERSLEGGASFLVSPGATPALLEALGRSGAPVLPGVATASEAMAAADAGFRSLKFFPAEPAGGLAYLKSLVGPLPDIVFCPTGGISAERVSDYLSLPNVGCVGGSWVATKQMLIDGDWEKISGNAKRAAVMTG